MNISTELEYILRIIIAGICGAIVGYERKSRLKEAGIRTHFIVALASALVMIVSKYGFFDLLNRQLLYGSDIIKLDPSRIASSIVTGIGFLGAGMIFVRKTQINGLTTAAGVWATAGIGMAIGSGMYTIGIITTVIVLTVQVTLHKNLRFLKIPSCEQLRIVAADNENLLKSLSDLFESKHIEIISLKAEKSENEYVSIDLLLKLPETFKPLDFMILFSNNPLIKRIDL